MALKTLGATIALCLMSAAQAGPPAHGAKPAEPFLFTPMDERSATISPDGKTAVFTLRIADYRSVLAVATRGPKGWSTPEIAPFSGPDLDGDPAFSANGKRLYFASNRGPDGKPKDWDIWQVDRTGGGWGEARPVSGKVNSKDSETGPAPAASGRLYFSSSRSGSGDIYVADPGSGGFGEPRKLGPQVNTDAPEVTPTVDRAETILMFASIGRKDQPLVAGNPYPKADIYMSRRTAIGWSAATRLGPVVNSLAIEASPRLLSDGRMLFMSEWSRAADHSVLLTPKELHRMLATPFNGLGNIYVIALAALGLGR
jgi:hypothetical protein